MIKPLLSSWTAFLVICAACLQVDPPSCLAGESLSEPARASLPPGAVARTGHPGLTHRDHVTCLAFTADGRSLISGSEDPTVRVWDLKTGRERRRWEDHRGRVEGLAVSPDGKRLASCGQDATVRLVDLATGRPHLDPFVSRGPVYRLVFAPDGNALCAVSCDLRAWDTRTGGPIGRVPELDQWTYALAMAAVGKTVVSGSQDGVVRIWNPSTGRLVRQWQGHRACIRLVAFVQGGTSLISSAKDGTVPSWHIDKADEGRLVYRGPPNSFGGG
jgi:WD40 repeat protein